MRISRNTVATVSFIVTDEKGQIVGRTEPGMPLVALIGHNYLVPGLEKALDGHESGDELNITLNPADAYGEYDESLVQTIDRAMFGNYPLEVGSVFEADSSVGPCAVVVKEIRDNEVVVDGNHPLSGKVLNFIVSVEDVRKASEEEIAHGHVHKDGVCPSEEHHCCCGGHHHHEEGEEHHCCGGHHHHEEGEEHHCCCGGHHHEEGEEHHCCGGHHHHEEGEEHHCCGGHHHHEEGEEHHCCGRHHHEEGEEHHCRCGRH